MNTELSRNAMMKRALAVPLSGEKQIVALELPTPTMPVREWATILIWSEAKQRAAQKERKGK